MPGADREAVRVQPTLANPKDLQVMVGGVESGRLRASWGAGGDAGVCGRWEGPQEQTDG